MTAGSVPVQVRFELRMCGRLNADDCCCTRRAVVIRRRLGLGERAVRSGVRVFKVADHERILGLRSVVTPLRSSLRELRWHFASERFELFSGGEFRDVFDQCTAGPVLRCSGPFGQRRHLNGDEQVDESGAGELDGGDGNLELEQTSDQATAWLSFVCQCAFDEGLQAGCDQLVELAVLDFEDGGVVEAWK